MGNRQKVFSNLIWRFLERGGAQILAFVVSVILARILDPSLYGSVALVTVITSILNVFVDSGMANALIQKKDTDDLDYSSVFFFNLVFCLLLYAGLFFAAPLIARIYKDMGLVPIIRVLGITILISGIKNVQQAYVSKTLQFRRFFFATLGGTVFSAAVGIAMAYMGYGVWALVFQQVLNAFVNTAILWLTVGWRPKLMFSLQRLKGLIAYGWKLLASALLDTVFIKVYQLIIGVRYSTADLAFYNKGDQLPSLVVENINSSIDSVLLPVLSEEQDNRERVRDMTRRAIKISTYIMMPLMFGLAVCAEPFIRLLLTEKWVPCVPYLQIFCFSYALYPLHTANLNAIKAMGRSDIFLTLELIKKGIQLVLIVITVRMGIMAMTLGVLAVGVISQLVNAYPNKRLLGYSYFDQLRDMAPAVLISAVMSAAIYPVRLLGLGDLVTLLIQVPAGAAVYLLLSKLFKVDSLSYVLSVAGRLLHRGGTQ